MEQRDSKGALELNAYDELNRPIRMWARDDAAQAVTLRQHLIYGDSSGLSEAEANARNLLGQLLEHYDEAGRIEVTSYDFKGNLLEKTRQVISDAAILALFDGAATNQWQLPAFRVDWQPPGGLTLEGHAATLLDPRPYTTAMRYDALNRATQLIYPEDVEGQRRVLRPGYNRAGALERVTLNGETFAEQIAYNAKGQRTLIAYGNGVLTRYTYNPLTFRLGRLRSERYTQPADHTYLPTGAPLQDFGYEYDLVGNITDIHDRTPESGIPNTLLGTNALDRAFTYDAIYRLQSATGREQALPPPDQPWDDLPKSQDVTLTRGYNELYLYDVVGNVEQLRHIANGGNFTRDFAHEAGSNRLAQMTIGQTNFAYTFDPSGNMTAETTSRHFEWNHSNQMRVFGTQTGGAEPSIHAHYLYDGAGIRVKKLVRRQSGVVSTTVYVDELLEHHAEGGIENNSLHVMDDQQRIALVRVGPPFPDDTTPAVKFHLGDYLGSSNLVVDGNGIFVNREEYTPYGETSFGSFARKRYRFTGKERDEESRLYYHGARYYAPWLGRWMAADPVGLGDGINLYAYVRNIPTRLVDLSGTVAAAPESEQERAAQVQRNRVPDSADLIVHMKAEARETVFTEPNDESDRRNYSSFEQFEGGGRAIRAEGSAADAKTPKSTPRGAWPTGYSYTIRHEVGYIDQGDTAADLMWRLQEQPNDFFPFRVVNLTDPNAGIVKGHKYDLQHTRFLGDMPNEVVVESTSSTSFTFLTLETHFDGPGARITFTTYEEDGIVYLEHDANAPNAGSLNATFAPAGAAFLGWKVQSSRLKNQEKRLLYSPEPIVNPYAPLIDFFRAISAESQYRQERKLDREIGRRD